MKKIILILIILFSSNLFGSNKNFKVGFQSFGYEQAISKSISIAGLVGKNLLGPIRNSWVYETKIYIYQDDVFQSNYYIAPFARYVTRKYTFNRTYFTRIGLLVGFKMQFYNFNITAECGYGKVSGNYIDRLNKFYQYNNGYNTSLSFQSALRIGWSF